MKCGCYPQTRKSSSSISISISHNAIDIIAWLRLPPKDAQTLYHHSHSTNPEAGSHSARCKSTTKLGISKLSPSRNPDMTSLMIPSRLCEQLLLSVIMRDDTWVQSLRTYNRQDMIAMSWIPGLKARSSAKGTGEPWCEDRDTIWRQTQCLQQHQTP